MNVQRREIINAYIQNKGEVKLKELEKLFPEVSTMTLRRDLSYLESKGQIVRVRGGAKSVNLFSSLKEDMYSLRAMENVEAKMKIAKKALEYVERGRSYFIDSGTTMMCLAKVLPDEDLSILTSGPNIALEVIKNNNPSVTLVGGRLSRNNLSTSGANSLNFIKDINVDIAFMATSGFSLEYGFTCGDYNECELKRAVIRKARKVILLMDVSKIDKNMPFTFATLKDIDVLICDKPLPENIMRAAERYGVEIK
ncbi:DeoR/GlpR family transcriptional regulator of sugar metabolism [Caldicoprobacter guelmensis]|uniref:DeoR/GlpR family DNA-binding transcription regulator n=1 Tax=Caldicoprobacter guelmensis TaxID=1170224 RepID=UPI00195B2A94|nr:DeoR/GlpR family DNA-binding transcription regulator [Caldicoprobacter guelmensis]MBM7582029.1 DeoR/GlpR family transcriptional regulator of sugar metabolism [Caldicoprobacter guelmensis]